MDTCCSSASGSSIIWGDVSSWVSAVATILALAGAIWAGYTAKKLYDREAQRDEVARTAARLIQARHIAAWLALDSSSEGPHELALYVRNGSQEPVYNVDVTLLVRDRAGDLQESCLDLAWQR